MEKKRKISSSFKWTKNSVLTALRSMNKTHWLPMTK